MRDERPKLQRHGPGALPSVLSIAQQKARQRGRSLAYAAGRGVVRLDEPAPSSTIPCCQCLLWGICSARVRKSLVCGRPSRALPKEQRTHSSPPLGVRLKAPGRGSAFSWPSCSGHQCQTSRTGGKPLSQSWSLAALSRRLDRGWVDCQGCPSTGGKLLDSKCCLCSTRRQNLSRARPSGHAPFLSF